MENPRLHPHNCVVDKHWCPACKKLWEKIYRDRIKRMEQIGLEVSGYDPDVTYHLISERHLCPRGLGYFADPTRKGKIVTGPLHSMSGRSWDIFDVLLKSLLKVMPADKVKALIEKELASNDKALQTHRDTAYKYTDRSLPKVNKKSKKA